ncbi:hypothetical protein L9F63_009605 [Diploptera punctata]|uniref:Pentraxin (PTX) domain-containing protein n=1 Tax=Diploptera punctata TaxID=6984 RepID=A0AAD8AJB5_DIPPU|nr:hypothetical protein L9F63_009605 [Diploptera punctata]
MNILLVLVPLLACSAVKGEWRPVAPQLDSESHLSLAYHAIQGAGAGAEDIFHQDNDQCALYKVSFVQDLYFQYIQYKTSLPDMKEFTVCMWHKFYNHSNDHPLFSYAVPNQPRAIYLWVSNSRRSSYFSLSVESHTFFRLNYPLRLNRWYHSCTSWNGRTGEWQIWINAERVGRGFHNRLVGHVIPGGGIAITGQEQRQLGGGFLEGPHSPKGSGGFLGEITQLYLYKAALAAGKAHRDHKHHHGNHASSTLPPPAPPSTGPPLPEHPLLISGQLVPRLNIQAQLGRHQGFNQAPLPISQLQSNIGQLQPSSGSIGQLQPSSGSIGPLQPSTSSISLPGVSSFSIQHSSSDLSLLTSSDDAQHTLFKRDEDKETAVSGQESSTSTRSKRSTSDFPKKSTFPPKKYMYQLEDIKIKKKTIGKHKVIKRAIEFGEGDVYEHHSSALIDGTDLSLLGGDFNPLGVPQQEEGGGESSGDSYPREPAEGEVMQVMNVCSGCAPEPFKKAELITWKNTPKKLYSGALYTLANPECKRF